MGRAAVGGAVGNTAGEVAGDTAGASVSDDQAEHAGERCRWCGTIFLTRSGPGRPRVYCSQSCRQQHYVERRTAVGDGRDPDRIVLSRSTVEDFESKRLQLKLAIDDVERAKAASGSVRAELFEWLLDYARDVVDIDLQGTDQARTAGSAEHPESSD